MIDARHVDVGRVAAAGDEVGDDLPDARDAHRRVRRVRDDDVLRMGERRGGARSPFGERVEIEVSVQEQHLCLREHRGAQRGVERRDVPRRARLRDVDHGRVAAPEL